MKSTIKQIKNLSYEKYNLITVVFNFNFIFDSFYDSDCFIISNYNFIVVEVNPVFDYFYNSDNQQYIYILINNYVIMYNRLSLKKPKLSLV